MYDLQVVNFLLVSTVTTGGEMLLYFAPWIAWPISELNLIVSACWKVWEGGEERTKGVSDD